MLPPEQPEAEEGPSPPGRCHSLSWRVCHRTGVRRTRRRNRSPACARCRSVPTPRRRFRGAGPAQRAGAGENGAQRQGVEQHGNDDERDAGRPRTCRCVAMSVQASTARLNSRLSTGRAAQKLAYRPASRNELGCHRTAEHGDAGHGEEPAVVTLDTQRR